MKANEELVHLLRRWDGRELEVHLRNGSILRVFNIAWGYDIGDDHAHVTTNFSPPLPGESIDFFYTHEVESVSDPETGAQLFPSS